MMSIQEVEAYKAPVASRSIKKNALKDAQVTRFMHLLKRTDEKYYDDCVL